MLNTTIIFRHRRENLKKCSLSGLENRQEIHFFSYPLKEKKNLIGVDDHEFKQPAQWQLTDFNKYFSSSPFILLTMNAPSLSIEDKDKGIVLIDGTWKLASEMIRHLPFLSLCIPRSLPEGYQTAYPRKQTHCPDPNSGLASVEALFLAYHLLNRDTSGLLDNYYWRKEFLIKNRLDF
jgi:pre-rRNA-processing protein TSR3